MPRPWIVHATEDAKNKNGSKARIIALRYQSREVRSGCVRDWARASKALEQVDKRERVYSVLRRGYIIYTILFVMNCGQSEHPMVFLHCASQRTSKDASVPDIQLGPVKPKLEPSTETKNTHEFRVTPRDPQG